MALYTKKLVPLVALILSFVTQRALTPLDYVEYFSGDRSISDGIAGFGYEGRSFDIRYDINYNFLYKMGIITALSLALRLRKDGLAWLAPPCSSWVSISRGSTHRSASEPLGKRPRSVKVIQNNRLVSRMSLLLDYIFRHGIFYIIEQPRTSIMWKHPRLKKTLKRHKALKVRADLGALGAESLKPVILAGTAPYLSKLQVVAPKKVRAKIQQKNKETGFRTTIQYVDRFGRRKFKGSSKMLKDTQSYPTGLGVAVGFAKWRYDKDTIMVPSDSEIESQMTESSYTSDHDCVDDAHTWKNLWCEE